MQDLYSKTCFKFIFVTIILHTSCILSCKHQESAPQSEQITSETPVRITSENNGKIILQPQSMYLGKITTDGTPLREGPNTDFKLTSTLLPKDEQVLITDWHDRWRKIRLLSNPEIAGWVHRQMLDQISLNKTSLSMNPQHLEAVYLNKPLSIQVKLDNQEKNLVFARGSGFAVLRKQNNQSLVRIPGTQLTQWIPENDAK